MLSTYSPRNSLGGFTKEVNFETEQVVKVR